MKHHIAALMLIFFCTSCATADFKVVDTLHAGMSQTEAEERIASFGFKREAAMKRPKNGWPSTDNTAFNLSARALATENKLQQRIESAESYPVNHGALGFGQLFLFYSAEDRLMEFYRYQIN